MISLPQGFKVGSMEAIDARLALTKTGMQLMDDNLMPPVYFTVCEDDSKIYVYNKDNELDPETGRFRLYAAGGGDDDSEPIAIEKIQGLFIEEKTEE